jgi:hypothetical protein
MSVEVEQSDSSNDSGLPDFRQSPDPRAAAREVRESLTIMGFRE